MTPCSPAAAPASNLLHHCPPKHGHLVAPFPHRGGGTSPPSLRPASCLFPGPPRSSLSLSLSSASAAAAAFYPCRPRKTTLVPAVLAPSSYGLRNATTTPFISLCPGSRMPSLASNNSRRVHTYFIFPRSTVCIGIFMALQRMDPVWREHIIGPLLLRCGVPASFLPQAFSIVLILWTYLLMICWFVDLFALGRRLREEEEYSRRWDEKYKAAARLMLRRINEELEEKRAAADGTGAGICEVNGDSNVLSNTDPFNF